MAKIADVKIGSYWKIRLNQRWKEIEVIRINVDPHSGRRKVLMKDLLTGKLIHRQRSAAFLRKELTRSAAEGMVALRRDGHKVPHVNEFRDRDRKIAVEKPGFVSPYDLGEKHQCPDCRRSLVDREGLYCTDCLEAKRGEERRRQWALTNDRIDAADPKDKANRAPGTPRNGAESYATAKGHVCLDGIKEYMDSLEAMCKEASEVCYLVLAGGSRGDKAMALNLVKRLQASLTGAGF